MDASHNSTTSGLSNKDILLYVEICESLNTLDHNIVCLYWNRKKQCFPILGDLKFDNLIKQQRNLSSEKKTTYTTIELKYDYKNNDSAEILKIAQCDLLMRIVRLKLKIMETAVASYKKKKQKQEEQLEIKKTAFTSLRKQEINKKQNYIISTLINNNKKQ